MRTLLIATLAALLGCGAASLLPPEGGVRASRAARAPAAVCGCHERTLPQWAAWRDSHRVWTCTVVLPRDESVMAQPCSRWNTAPPAPTGFDVRVTP